MNRWRRYSSRRRRSRSQGRDAWDDTPGQHVESLALCRSVLRVKVVAGLADYSVVYLSGRAVSSYNYFDHGSTLFTLDWVQCLQREPRMSRNAIGSRACRIECTLMLNLTSPHRVPQPVARVFINTLNRLTL